MLRVLVATDTARSEPVSDDVPAPSAALGGHVWDLGRNVAVGQAEAATATWMWDTQRVDLLVEVVQLGDHDLEMIGQFSNA